MNRILDRYVGNIVVLLAIVSYFELFKIAAIPYSLRVLSQIAVICLIIFLILLRTIYHPGHRLRMNFATPIALMMVGIIPSFFVAQSFHNQNFIVSLYSSRIILLYSLYYFVHLFKVDIRFILRVIIFTGLMAVVMYYVQLYLHPAKVLDIHTIEGRGTIRLFVAGMICTQVAYFYFLNQFFTRNKLIYIVFALLTLSIFVLQGTRQLIFALSFLTLVNLIFARKIRSKLFITFILSLSVLAVIMLFREIFLELTQVSSSQIQNLGGGVRIKGARFFLTDFMPSFWAYLFGNGDAGLGSAYEQEMIMHTLKNGYYLSDIGIIGDYVKYGVLFCAAGLFLIIKALRFTISHELLFLKFYIVSQCFTLLTGYGFLGGADVNIILILYVFDVNRAEKLRAALSDESPDQQ